MSGVINLTEVKRLLEEETFAYELNPDWERVVNVKLVEAVRALVDAPRRFYCAEYNEFGTGAERHPYCAHSSMCGSGRWVYEEVAS